MLVVGALMVLAVRGTTTTDVPSTGSSCLGTACADQLVVSTDGNGKVPYYSWYQASQLEVNAELMYHLQWLQLAEADAAGVVYNDTKQDLTAASWTWSWTPEQESPLLDDEDGIVWTISGQGNSPTRIMAVTLLKNVTSTPTFQFVVAVQEYQFANIGADLVMSFRMFAKNDTSTDTLVVNPSQAVVNGNGFLSVPAEGGVFGEINNNASLGVDLGSSDVNDVPAVDLIFRTSAIPEGNVFWDNRADLAVDPSAGILSEEDDELGLAWIIGIAVVGLVVVLLIIGGIVYAVQAKKRQDFQMIDD